MSGKVLVALMIAVVELHAVTVTLKLARSGIATKATMASASMARALTGPLPYSILDRCIARPKIGRLRFTVMGCCVWTVR